MQTFLEKLWAKTSRLNEEYHPLLFHMIDVGSVARIMWERCIAGTTRQCLSACLDMEITDAGNVIAFWASLHDLGKAGPAFQQKYSPVISQLKEQGFDFPPMAACDLEPHGMVTAWAIKEEGAEQITGLKQRRQAVWLGRVLAGHHGAWPASLDGQVHMNLGGEVWRRARLALVEMLQQVFYPKLPLDLNGTREDINIFFTLFTFIIV